MSNASGSGHPDREEASVNAAGQSLVYFAAERTLMAWIRTALAFMALGFVIDRFGLVIRSMTTHLDTVSRSSTLSFFAGAALVVAGALMAVVAAVRYARFLWRYRQAGDIHPGYGLEPAIFFTVIATLAGALIAGYLMTAPL